MRRSEINRAWREALACFARHGWALPPSPRWDITDFGLGDFSRHGLVLVNLAEEPEYSEKLMYARRGQETPCHCHRRKKEDIICRAGELTVRLWASRPSPGAAPGEILVLAAGSRVTIRPGTWHAFAPSSDDCVIGEVATANDDTADNVFLDARVGRFPAVEEDEPADVRLLSD
ncbi:MAG TPA: D-lyxose/D-mannose family sugar isomerase [Opitutaceae bacterium]|jgi:hypothetical protein